MFSDEILMEHSFPDKTLQFNFLGNIVWPEIWPNNKEKMH